MKVIQKRIKNVGVYAGLIMLCDEKYYEKWGNKTNYRKNLYGVICSQRIMIKPGNYKVKWFIENTWNGAISGEGEVKIESGFLTISDPCYCIDDWDKWLEDTNFGTELSGERVLIIDEMGGDGCYDVDLKLSKQA